MSKEFVKYKLPKNWIWTTIGELGIVASGGTPSTRERRYWDGDISWITPADLTNYKDKYISSGRRFITVDGLEESSAKLLPKGTILFSSRAPIGYVAIAKNEIATNQGFKNLILTKWTNPDYIFYYLKSATQLAQNMASGTTFLELSASKFSQIPIPIPPLSEQKHIVTKLDELYSELDNALNNFILVQHQLKVYRLAILRDAFEGKLTEQWRQDNLLESGEFFLKQINTERKNRYKEEIKNWDISVKNWEKNGRKGKKPRNPKPINEIKKFVDDELITLPGLPENKWIWSRLNNVTDKITDGEHQKPKTERSGIYFLSAKDVHDSGVSFEDPLYISKETARKSRERCDPEKGDVLIVSRGATVGRSCYVDTDKIFCLLGSVILLKPDKSIHGKFLNYYIKSAYSQQLLIAMSGATAQQAIYLRDIQNLPIPIMPLEEQNAIIEMLEAQFSIINHLEECIVNSIQRIKILKQSALKKAFEGRLVNLDLADESVLEIKQKIQEEKKKYFEKKKTQKSDKPKKIKKMNKPLDIEDILKSSSTPLAAKDVWEQSKYKDDIEAFYAELKKLQGKVKEVEKGMLILTNES